MSSVPEIILISNYANYSMNKQLCLMDYNVSFVDHRCKMMMILFTKHPSCFSKATELFSKFVKKHS